MKTEIAKVEWYATLVEDCKTIITETLCKSCNSKKGSKVKDIV